MPRTRSLAFSELKIGMLTVFAAAMAGIMVFAVGGAGGFAWQRYPLKTRFANIATVKAGTPVRLAGIEVGTVTEVQFAGSGAEAWLEVSKDVRPLITDRSLAVIGAISMLGEGAVDITSGPGGAPIPDWGYVPSGVDASSLAGLQATAGESLSEVGRLVAGREPGVGAGAALVDAHLAAADDAVDQRLGRAAQLTQQEVVEALAGTALVDCQVAHRGGRWFPAFRDWRSTGFGGRFPGAFSGAGRSGFAPIMRWTTLAL